MVFSKSFAVQILAELTVRAGEHSKSVIAGSNEERTHYGTDGALALGAGDVHRA
jgi:hypothetical protein